MTYQEFQTTVTEMLDDIPEEFLDGLQGVHVFEHAKADEELRGVYRLGEYLHSGQPHFLAGGATLGRHIALYYGSFKRIAGKGFDWEANIWDTLTHELRHHVETLAGDDSLVEEDRARMNRFRQRAKRLIR